jgi:CDP-diacylglycerol---glycerol-3-phosphate 3-phosphatidyltransferase
MNLANKITMIRLFMVIVLVTLLAIPYHLFASIPIIHIVGAKDINIIYLIAFIIFSLAAFSDFIDGYIARKFNMITDFGKFMDPVVDKVLVNASLILLVISPTWVNNDQMTIPVILVVVMIVRDLIVDAMRLVANNKQIVVAANIFGKIKTFLQMIAIPLVFLNDWPFSYIGYPVELSVTQFLLYAATLFSVVSGIIYLYQNRIVFKVAK